MSTGQKYSGKGEDATSPQQNGSGIEQTVNSDTPAATSADPATTKPTLLAETFSFDELVTFNNLSDTGKTLISGLVNSGNYPPEILKRALLHIAQTPDTASPCDVVNGESLQSILNGKTVNEAALAETLADRITQISGVLSHDGRTYVRLSDYLEEVTNTEEGIEAFRQEFLSIITQYMMSQKFLALQDPDKDKKLTDLHSGIALMVSRVGRYKDKPVPDQAFLKPVDLIERPLQRKDYEVLMNNPACITSVDQLHEWVARLQFINTTLMEVYANLQDLHKSQRELVEVMKATLLKYEELIPQLRAKIQAPTEKAPGSDLYLSQSFCLSTSYRSTSQAHILYFALLEYRDSRRKQYEEEIINGEFDCAYHDLDDAQTAQGLLDDLLMGSLDLAKQNYLSARFRGNDERFRSERATDVKWYEKNYNDFLALHRASTKGEDPAESHVSTETPDPTADL